MLGRLGRWLRAAGYDTAMSPAGTPDARLMALARSERRLLVTRDRKLLEYRDAPNLVIYLESQTTEACALELAGRTGIRWLLAPFSRCLICNTPLEPGSDADLARIPPHSRQTASRVWHCPDCGRWYWHGGHVRRMRRRLESLAAHQRHECHGQHGP